MSKTWKPTTAGILSIIAGIVGLLSGIGLAVGVGLALLRSLTDLVPRVPGEILAVFGIPWIILGIVAIIGGIYALKRRIWGLALAGSICASLHPLTWLLGIAAIVFTAIGKSEFQ